MPTSVTRRTPPLRGLYAITPDTPDTDLLLTQVQAVLAGGCSILQYRDKLSNSATRQRRAKRLAELCHATQANLIVNDDLTLALEVGAAGVHLGGEDGDLYLARQRLGPHRILGASCYASVDRAIAAVNAGASYVAFGAIFPSVTKPDAIAAPLDLFTRYHRALTKTGLAESSIPPVCAIGGITLDNATSVIQAGAAMVAVITDVFSAPDITTRTTCFQTLFSGQPL